MLNILASFAKFERALIAERVRAGMDRARRQGKHVGRPRKVNGEGTALEPAVRTGRISRRDAAHALGVSERTVTRLLGHRTGQKGGPCSATVQGAGGASDLLGASSAPVAVLQGAHEGT
ncbi:MAG TPA: recombinase family protein [bacterium]|nr:recombinase family protein [bacterium]